MKRLSLFLLLFILLSASNMMAQTISSDFMYFKKSEMFPSFAGVQYEQMRTVISYDKVSNNYFGNDQIFISNDLNLTKLNMGLGLNYSYSNYGSTYSKNYNLMYNYRIYSGGLQFVPGIGFNFYSYDANYGNNNVESALVTRSNLSFLIKSDYLSFNLGLENFNQPTITYTFDSAKVEYKIPLIYQTCIDYRFLNNVKFINYVNCFVYADLQQESITKDKYANLSCGLNTKIKSVRFGFGADYTNLLTKMPHLQSTNYMFGYEKDNIKLYYVYRPSKSQISNISSHSITLSASFDIFEDRSEYYDYEY